MKKSAGVNFQSRVTNEIIARFNKSKAGEVGKFIEKGDWESLHNLAVYMIWNSRLIKHPHNEVLDSFPSEDEFELKLRPSEDGKEILDDWFNKYNSSVEGVFE